MHRTFIEFGSMAGMAPPTTVARTAPAAMGLSMKDMFDSWKVVTTTTSGESPMGQATITVAPPSSTASSARVSTCSSLGFEQAAADLPDVTYRFSPISAKAAGYWATPSSPRTPPAASPPRSGTPGGAATGSTSRPGGASYRNDFAAPGTGYSTPCGSPGKAFPRTATPSPRDGPSLGAAAAGAWAQLLQGLLEGGSRATPLTEPWPEPKPKATVTAKSKPVAMATGSLPKAAPKIFGHAGLPTVPGATPAQRWAMLVPTLSPGLQTECPDCILVPPSASTAPSAASAAALSASPPAAPVGPLPSARAAAAAATPAAPPAAPPGVVVADKAVGSSSPKTETVGPSSTKAAFQRYAMKPSVGTWLMPDDDGEDGASSASSDDGDSSGDDDDQGLCPKYSESAELPSRGSAAHSEGTCKRCCFFPKGRCNNGYDCQFCHFAHEKRKPKNKKKKKRRKNKRQTIKAWISGQNQGCNSPGGQSPQAQTQVTQFAPQGQLSPPSRPTQLIVHGLQFVPPPQVAGGDFRHCPKAQWNALHAAFQPAGGPVYQSAGAGEVYHGY